MVRLVAIDLDDTLLKDDLSISDRCRFEIDRVRKKGVHVILATGRMYSSARPYALELGLTGPMVTYQGALIKTVEGETLRHDPVPPEPAKEILAYAEKHLWTLNAYVDDQLYVKELDPWVDFYTAIAGVKAHVVGPLESYVMRGSTKMVMIASKERVAAELPELNHTFSHRVQIVQSKPQYVEITRSDVSKGEALSFLTAELKISPSEVMAIGDGFNDVSMLEFAEIGVAVANAPDGVKAYANHVTSSNEDDGVAEALRTFIK